MQNGVRPGLVLVGAALVAAFVAAVVGGGAALLVARWDESGGAGTTRVRGAADADVRLQLTHDRPVALVAIEVPDDAVAVHVTASCDGGPVELSARFGDDAAGPFEHEAADTSAEPELDLSVDACECFEPGPLLVRVEAMDPPGDAESLRVSLRATLVRDRVDASIDAGASWSGETSRASGFRRTVAVRVPAGAKALRLDVADATADLDLHVATESTLPWRPGRRDAESTLATAEWKVVEAGSGDCPLPAGGTLLVSVTDASQRPYPVAFRLVTTLGEDPPPDLAALPEIPLPRDPRERALAGVVELLSDGAGGSGTIVSEDGRILTARHVVEAAARAVADGRPDEAPTIVVAMSLDARSVARDLFLAEVVHEDRALDLAMLRITAGARGTPLPDGLRFPHVRMRRRSAIYLGEPLWTVGYPTAGGTGSRVPVTLARGCVSGWDRDAACTTMKTDAFVAPGSSGGAALDDRWELVGVTTATTDGGERGPSLGTIVPVEAIPPSWLP